MSETNPLMVDAPAESALPGASDSIRIVGGVENDGAGGKPTSLGTAPLKKPNGRPPIHGMYSKAAGSDGKRPVRPLTPEEIGKGAVLPDVAGLSESDVQSLASELLSIVDEAAAGWLRIQAQRAEVPEAEAQKIVEASKLGERRTKFMARLVPHCVREWGLQGQVSPTTAFALMAGVWFAGFWRATQLLEKFRKETDPDAT
jgi:hypothetical protein